MSFRKQLLQELAFWQEKQIISPEQAAQIESLYPENQRDSYNRTLIIFSILGALLIGGGIILILARNWDELPIWTRAVIAFLPLLTSQVITGMLLHRKIASEAWREGVGLFYAIAVYACIALISQIYHLPGAFDRYIILCSLLILPIGYVLRATTPMLLYFIGITWWALYFDGLNLGGYSYMYFLGALVPALLYLWIRFKENLYSAHSVLLVGTLAICGMVIIMREVSNSDGILIGWSLYFSMLYLISVKWLNDKPSLLLQPLKLIGFAGGILVLFFLPNSFSTDIPILALQELPLIILFGSMALFCSVLMFMVIDRERPAKTAQILLIGGVYLLTLAFGLFTPGLWHHYSPMGYVPASLYLLAIGVVLIINGFAELRFSLSTMGTGLIALLILVRFFDTSMDFLVRGLAFIIVGVLFLAANLYISKRLKKEAISSAEDS